MNETFTQNVWREVAELAGRRSVFAGWLAWDAEHAGEVLPAWLAWTRRAPEEVASVARLLQVPVLRSVSAPLRGRRLVAVELAFVGSYEEGVDELRSLHGLGPDLDTFAMWPASALPRLHLEPRGAAAAVTGGFDLDDPGDAGLAALLAVAGPHSGSPLVSADLWHLGGALSGLDADLRFVGRGLSPEPAFDAPIHARLARVREALAPWCAGAALPLAA